jgi:hypothetical protein
MNKKQLVNGMVVKTSGGRYGVVCLKDATNENVLKFLYDPDLLIGNGIIDSANYGETVVSLDDFDDDLAIRINDEETKERLVVWSIDAVYSLNNIYKRESN